MIHWACTLGSSCSQTLQLFQQLVIVSTLSPGSFSFAHPYLTTLPQFCDCVTCGNGTAARDRPQNWIVCYRNELHPHRIQCSSFCARKMSTFSFLETCLFRKALTRTTSHLGCPLPDLTHLPSSVVSSGPCLTLRTPFGFHASLSPLPLQLETYLRCSSEASQLPNGKQRENLYMKCPEGKQQSVIYNVSYTCCKIQPFRKEVQCDYTNFQYGNAAQKELQNTQNVL